MTVMSLLRCETVGPTPGQIRLKLLRSLINRGRLHAPVYGLLPAQPLAQHYRFFIANIQNGRNVVG